MNSDDNKCYSNCPDGKYEDISVNPSVCKDCNSSCKTCTGPSNSDCIVC